MQLKRQCDSCGKKLTYTDERYELKHIKFKGSKGISNTLAKKYCPGCAKTRFGEVK